MHSLVSYEVSLESLFGSSSGSLLISFTLWSVGRVIVFFCKNLVTLIGQTFYVPLSILAHLMDLLSLPILYSDFFSPKVKSCVLFSMLSRLWLHMNAEISSPHSFLGYNQWLGFLKRKGNPCTTPLESSGNVTHSGSSERALPGSMKCAWVGSHPASLDACGIVVPNTFCRTCRDKIIPAV